MGNLALTYLPPQNWQDFQKFLKGVVDVIWQQEGWQIYGRPGQNQSGIDLFGYDDRNRFTGIQCKKKSATDSDGQLLTNSLLTRATIEDEISLAEKIQNPKIERFIFATTSSRDTKIQNILNEINASRKSESKFYVDIWFWEDLQVYIENHIALMYWYYTDLLESIHRYDKNIHILTLLRQAFTRPAFKRMIMSEESGADFLLAIKNTQEAITTGKLYNRRGDLIATSYNYQKLSNSEWRQRIAKIYNYLDEVRLLYGQGVLRGAIEEFPTCLVIREHHLSESFNRLRALSLMEMNLILRAANLEEIESALIDGK